MKDLGKTIAKYRKEHKLNQSQLAKELENYDIYVKQNSISAWELGTAIPNARQFLALCEILEIYDIYTDFIGQSPLNPFRNLNETVLAADTLTASDKHDATARIIARIRFFFT